MKINEFINEDFGSIPPLPELILMAVLAKTTVDVIKGSFKVAMKTGKGIKKYRQLHKQAQSMIKNAVIGEIAKSDLDAKMHKMALDRHHAAAIEAMHGLVKKLGQRHTLGYYAATIGRAFAQINPRELEQMYKQQHQVEENFADRQMAMLQKQDNYLEKMWTKDILEKYGKNLDEFYKIRKALDGKVVKIDGEEVELEFEMDTVAGFVDVWDNNSGKDVNPFTLKFMEITENFKDGKVKGKSRPGRVKKSGASCNGSVTELRAKAKKASGEKAKMYHWCANMKAGKKK